MENEQIAVFGGGCFWCVEAVFNRLRGVKSAVSGYMGGHVDKPTYRQVCGGDTGHVEVVQVTFDPREIRYKDLLEVYFSVHDPTTLNQQGNDVGEQYRSVYPAEEYHQEYYENNRHQPYCQFVIAPKLKKFEKKFGEKMRA